MLNRPPEARQELRQRAEEQFIANDAAGDGTLSIEETEQLIHELRVHQIELEMQNEELRRTQHELDTMRARYFDLYNLAPVGYLTFSKNGLIQEANLAAATMIGIVRSDLINRPMSQFIFSEDQDTYFLYRKKILESDSTDSLNSTFEWDMRLLHHDGSHFWVHIHTNTGDNGNFQIAFSDISRRKQVEDVQSFLARSSSGRLSDETFFNTLARYLAQSLDMDFVCIDILEGDGLNARTVAVWCDGHFEDNVTYALKDTPCGDLVGKDVCCFPASVCQFFPRDQVLQDLRAESYVGVTLWSHIGKPIGLIALIRRKPLDDRPRVEATLKIVAERAAAELELLEVEELLNKAEAEKRLLEQQFQQAQKLESLGVLAGGIAHDFNNILAIIIGHCSLATMHPEAAGEHIAPIEKSADRAAELCRQMLTYAGKASFTLTQVNMAALVDEMLQMLKATINHNISIKADILTDISDITGDASQLRQVVMNLIINASEAIGEAQGVIRVFLEKKKIKSAKDHLGRIIKPGLYACLEVTDTGCGMDDETRRRIFEPFYTTKFTGRGLGMSAVLGILSAHNGALQFTSKPGKGTTFTVFFPISDDKSAGDESSEQAASQPWQGCGTILLAEDENQLRKVVVSMLKLLGFTVLEASDGREALELYQKHSAEILLVVTDIGMPVMDGYELFRELKTLNPALPIIVSTGFGDTVVTERIAREDIAGLVIKPYKFDQLQEILKGVVEGAE